VLWPAAILVALAFVAQFFTRSPATLRLLDNFHWTLSYSAGAAMAWMGVRRAPPGRRAPIAWLAAGLTGYAIGQVLWDLQVLVGWNPFPAPSDAFFLMQGAFPAIGLALAMRGFAPAGRAGIAALDVGSVAVAALALALSLYLPLRGQNSVLAMAVLIAYPVTMLTAACIGFMMLPVLHLRATLGWFLLVGGLAANGALWMDWNAMTLAGTLADGTRLNECFSVVALTIGAGIALWEPVCETDARRVTHYEAFLRLMPMGVVVGVASAVVVAFTFPGVPSLVQSIVAYSGAVVAILAFARQSVMLFERDRMLEAEDKFRAVFESAHDAILLMDLRHVVDCNPAAERLFGLSRSGLLQLEPLALSPDAQPDGRSSRRVALEYFRAAMAGEVREFPWRLRRADGTGFEAEVSLHRVDLAQGPMLQAIVRDVTERIEGEAERRRLEERLRHAARMEAVGRLAGGVAHDFNNILTVIMGTSELALLRTPEGDHHRKELEEIRRSAQRAASLTAQLLAFSRKQVIAPVPCDLTELVHGALGMLRRLIGEDIELVFEPAPSRSTVHVDRTQLEQVLVNLAVNARDAMPRGGRLVITTRDVQLGLDECASRAEARPGAYVQLQVRDSGTGIPAEVLEHVFEPFFTTKEPGSGTGLGLATVYGIVQQSGGFIDVVSEAGHGSCFTLHFPATATAETAPESAGPVRGPRGRERILLVEDEAMVRELAARVLGSLGYEVTSASTTAEALRIAGEGARTFDLLVTDVIMPGMNGKQLFEELHRTGSASRALYISGYTANILAPVGVLDPDVRLLQKPFALGDFAAAVRDALDHRPGGVPGAAGTVR
jgi:two-component system cell cycle sensor histidine kinase/response regulator CckA